MLLVYVREIKNNIKNDIDMDVLYLSKRIAMKFILSCSTLFPYQNHFIFAMGVTG